jgi:hypothetical protein
VLKPAQAASVTPGNLATDFRAKSWVDNVRLEKGWRLLLTNQEDQSENGAYDVNAEGPPTFRGLALPGDFVYVRRGLTNGARAWVFDGDPGAWHLFGGSPGFIESTKRTQFRAPTTEDLCSLCGFWRQHHYPTALGYETCPFLDLKLELFPEGEPDPPSP